MTDAQKKMKRYTNAVERKLNMPKEIRVRVMNDFISSIEGRREAGRSDEAIYSELGSPKKAAAELNEQMKEYTYVKSPLAVGLSGYYHRLCSFTYLWWHYWFAFGFAQCLCSRQCRYHWRSRRPNSDLCYIFCGLCLVQTGKYTPDSDYGRSWLLQTEPLPEELI